MAAVVSSLRRNHGAGAFLDLFNNFFFAKTQKTFALHFIEELQIFCGELCFNRRSHMHLPVVVDARKIDGWFLLFDCLWMLF
jgi:hypothetical protein